MQLQAGERVEIFLKRKLLENNLKRIHLSKKSSISSRTINGIYNQKQNNVSLKTVLSLADYFSCSVDEVLGRNSFTEHNNVTYLPVTPEEAMNKIRNFIKTKFEESNVNIFRFSKSCSLKEGVTNSFIKQNSKHENLYCNNILIIADHFDISIDKLIGRSNNQSKVISNNKVNTTEITENSNKPEDISQKLSTKDASKLEEIKQNYEQFQNEIKNKINTLNGVKSKVKDNSQSR